MNKFLNSCIVVFLISWLGRELYSESLDYFQLTEDQSLIEWGIKAVRDTALFLFVGVSIIWGIWSYKDAPNKRKAKWSIGFSIGFGLFLAVSAGLMYQKYSEFVGQDVPKISDNLDTINALGKYLDLPEHTVQEKSKNSHEFASTVFMESGMRIEVMDIRGNKVKYEPTPEDNEFRQKAERVRLLEQHSLYSLKMAWVSLSSLLIASILIGCIATGARNAYNQQLKRTP